MAVTIVAGLLFALMVVLGVVFLRPRMRAHDIPGQTVQAGVILGNVTLLQGPGSSARPLRLDWSDLTQDVFSLLDWRSRLVSPPVGREREMQLLLDWVRKGRNPRGRVLAGAGGEGKTRLAAELAQILRDEGWAAGFVRLEEAWEYAAGVRGTLVLIDYPEEQREAVRKLLGDLASVELPAPLRILLLSRYGAEVWQDEIDRAHATAFFDERPVVLAPLDPQDSWRLFEEAQRQVARRLGGSQPQAIEASAFIGWLARASENRRSLFVQAAAVASALEPARSILHLSHSEVVEALARRELARLRNEGQAAGLDPEALPRLLAMAAIAGGLDSTRLRQLAASPELDLALPPPEQICQRLSDTGRLRNDLLPAPAPDIVATALVVEVFKAAPERSPEWLWAALAVEPVSGIERFARPAYDAEVTLEHREDPARLSTVLERALAGRPERIAAVLSVFLEKEVPLSISRIGSTVIQAALETTLDAAKRASLFYSLDTHLAAQGRLRQALQAIQEATKIYRRLARAAPSRFKPNLAASLINLANRLFEVGQPQAALGAIREGVELYQLLASSMPGRFQPNLAMGLNGLSAVLSELGDRRTALAEMKKAVEIWNRLSTAEPARFESSLALCSNNLSLLLSEVGQRRPALEAIDQAVRLYRHLATQEPARFEPDLAMSLHNLAKAEMEVGEPRAALEAYQLALEIFRRLAATEPGRFQPSLAVSLSNIVDPLVAVGKPREALEAAQESVELNRRLAATEPSRSEPDLATSLNNLFGTLSDLGKASEALMAIQEAVRIFRRLAASTPARFEVGLAISLNNLSEAWQATGEPLAALRAIQEAVAIYRRLAVAESSRFAPYLAGSLAIEARLASANGDFMVARSLFEEAIILIRPFANQLPGSQWARWLIQMESDLAKLP